MDWSSAPDAPKPFTLVERDRRWAIVRKEMAARQVDVLLVMPQWSSEDAIYLANQVGVVIFPIDGAPTILVGGEGSNRSVTHEVWIADRASATARGSTRVPYGAAAAERLRAMSLEGKRLAVAGLEGSDIILVRQPEGYVNYTSMVKIREALPDTTIVDGTPIMAEARHQKSEEELGLIRTAVRAAEASAAALAHFARPGVLQAEVFGQMLLEQYRMGATEVMVSWCGGAWGEHKWRFTTPPSGKIGDSWYIGTEIGPSIRGYNCQVSEPIVVGKPTDEARDIWKLGKEAFYKLCELMRPDNTWDEVEAGVKAVGKGSRYAIEFLIHGRGLGNEGPMLIPVDTHDHVRGVRVREGSVYILKPYAFPSDGTYAHVTRSHDVTWGDTVVVRKNGAERLGTRPHELIVV